jgi:site-specific recombinase XerD
VSELVNLRLSDVDLVERVMRIEHAKGNKAREIPLEKKVTAALKQYLSVRPFSHDEHVFLSYQGSGISLRGVKKLVTKYKERAGIHKKVSCHSLRHTFASAKAEQGVSAYHLQQFLGHSSLAVTQRYVHLTKSAARKVMEASSL